MRFRTHRRFLRSLAWLVAVAAVLGLAFFRGLVDTEYAFASAALVPIVAATWIGGRTSGLALALVAMLAWTWADIASDRHFSAQWIPYANALTRLVNYGFVVMVVTKLRQSLARERGWATHDPLTGLLNRRAFLEDGEAEVKRARRYGHPLAVAFVDLDNFKEINDTKGHAMGDEALRKVAAALQASLRTNDLLARLGGDEFAVALPETGLAAAAETGQKIKEAICAALTDFPPASASVGVAWFMRADPGFLEMLEVADALMYEIKADGKNEVRVRRL